MSIFFFFKIRYVLDNSLPIALDSSLMPISFCFITSLILLPICIASTFCSHRWFLAYVVSNKKRGTVFFTYPRLKVLRLTQKIQIYIPITAPRRRTLYLRYCIFLLKVSQVFNRKIAIITFFYKRKLFSLPYPIAKIQFYFTLWKNSGYNTKRM